MRHYEAMYIIDPDLTDEQIEPIVEKYKKVVSDMGAVVGETGKLEQGRRKLAYEVNGHREGIYIMMPFEANADVPLELDRVFRISDDVFRHIVVRQDEDEE